MGDGWWSGVNYYKRHIGDYAKKAGHLSVLEHGIYTLLLDSYYDREHGPTKAEAVRWSRARSESELAALEAVLADFFTFDGDRYRQARVEDELTSAAAVAAANKANGKRGGRPRKEAHNPVETHSVNSDKPDESEKNPNPLIHQSTNPEEAKALVQRSAARFSDFWSVYPVKKGKSAAEASWAKHGCDAMADRIIDHVGMMQEQDRDWLEGYAPHGSTYVNQQGWNDEPKTMKATNGGQQSKTMTAMQRLQEKMNGLDNAGNHGRLPEAAVLELGSDTGDRHD